MQLWTKGSAGNVALNGDTGVFSGYASVFDTVDSQKDMILRGAFSRSLEKRAGEVKLLWQHRFEEPVGTILDMREDTHGLYIRARLLLGLKRGREAYALLKAKAVSGLSIGFTPKRSEVDPATGVRLLRQVDLWEVSLVTFPANQRARVTDVKRRPVLA